MKIQRWQLAVITLGIMLSKPSIADDWPYAKVTCDKENKTVRIEEFSADDRAEIPNVQGVQDLYALTEVKTLRGPSIDDDVIVKKKDFWFKCKLGQAEYKVRISPWKFSPRVNGMCGAYSPSIELTVWRGGLKLMNKIVFSGYCNPPDSESAIGAITLQEESKNASIDVSGAGQSQTKVIAFPALPKMFREDIVRH